MEAGKLDRRITVERATTTTDAYGGEVATWVPLGTVWAAVEPISDGERFRAAEVAAQVTTRFRIRWGLGVTVEDRVVYDGRTYGIVGVKEIGRREGQEITAAARAE
jgi:SPP1 family predicted phage head-tail adaptor